MLKRKKHFASQTDFSSKYQGVYESFHSSSTTYIQSTRLPEVGGTVSNIKSYDCFPVEVICMQKWWCHSMAHSIVSLVVLWPKGFMKTIIGPYCNGIYTLKLIRRKKGRTCCNEATDNSIDQWFKLTVRCRNTFNHPTQNRNEHNVTQRFQLAANKLSGNEKEKPNKKLNFHGNESITEGTFRLSGLKLRAFFQLEFMYFLLFSRLD